MGRYLSGTTASTSALFVPIPVLDLTEALTEPSASSRCLFKSSDVMPIKGPGAGFRPSQPGFSPLRRLFDSPSAGKHHL